MDEKKAEGLEPEKAVCEECGCEECECDEEEIFELVDDEGNVVKFYPVAGFDYKDEEYMVFEPAEPDEDFEEGEAVIFKVDHEGEEVVYTPIETEEKLNEVFEEFLRLQDECDEEEEGQEKGCDCCKHDGEGCCKH